MNIVQKTELLKSVPKRNEAIKWRELGNEGILLHPGSGDFFQVSETGLIIWQQLDGQKSIEEIIKDLALHFDASYEELARDAIEFMEELINKRLVLTS